MNATFDDLDLQDSTRTAVSEAGYEVPTEVQQRAIPELLAGRDVLATAQTGTGKTAAFVLPMLHQVKPSRSRGGASTPAALVLTPTRELAVQIVESIHVYGRGTRLSSLAIYGGASRNRQIDALRNDPDIVVATPGRLLDLIEEGSIDLGCISYLVLDEADRMLDMGFIPAVRRIVAMIPRKRQTALFSATMPAAIQEVAREMLTKPVRVTAESGELRIDRIEQSVMYVDQTDKIDLLTKLVQERQMFRVLVFTRTKHRARKVAKVLSQKGIATDAIHGDKGQGARTRALADFRGGRLHVLVATDVASRGIDVDDISHVINFELPNEPETYIHRVGRTARAGTGGCAISLCDSTEMAYVRDIERLMGSSLRVDRDQPFHRDRTASTPVRSGGGAARGADARDSRPQSRSPRSRPPRRHRRR